MRKVIFGGFALTLVWVFAMWAPAVTGAEREAALLLMGSIVTAVIGANMYERRQERKKAELGAGQASGPTDPGAAPAAGVETAGMTDV